MDGVGGLQGRQDALGPGQQAHALERLVVGRAQDLQATGLVQRRELRPDARVVEPGRDRVGLRHLAVLVLQQVRARAVQHAGGATGQRRGMPAGQPLPRGLDADEARVRLADEAGQQADGVRAAADAGHGDVRQAAFDRRGPARRPRRR